MIDIIYILCIDSHRCIEQLEVVVNYLVHYYLGNAIHEERLEEARRAHLASSVAQGRRRETLERFSVSRALGRLLGKKTAAARVPGTSPSVCPS